MKKINSICLSIIVLAMILMSLCFVSAATYKISKVSSGEYRLYYNGTHFASILNNGGTFVVRPHPGLDINGWGSSLYLQPFLPGSVLRASTITGITATTDKIKVSVNGKVSKGSSSNYGSWSSTILFTFDSVNREVKGIGVYAITLSGKLSNTTGDLNLYKLASNYLDDVPLLNGSIGDTGDISYVDISGNGLNARWNPSLQPGYFPIEEMTNISVNAVGQYYQVDSAKQGYAAIKAAYKPTIKISLSPYSSSYVVPIVFGGYYDVAQSKYFWADNVGITPLILKKNTKTAFKFNVQISSTPIAGDANRNITKPIKCYKASDCGTDSFTQNFCSGDNIVFNTTNYICNSPGTTSSYCTSEFVPVIVSYCPLGCKNAQCNQPICGNRIKEGSEQCDDGNLVNGDGCSSSCTIEIPSCVTPVNRMNITSNTVFCKGTYNLPNGINILSGSLTLDCNGAVIRGNSIPGSIGILAGSYKGKNVIKNCIIENFSQGIFNYNGYNHNYTNNTFTNTGTGIWLEASYNDLIQANNFTGNSGGVMVYWYNTGEIIKNNIFENNYFGFSTAWGSNNNEVINNTFKGNYEAISDGGSYDRITGANVYSYNTIINNSKGIFIEQYCNGDLVAQNTIVNNSYGLYVHGANNTILLNNLITNNIQAYNTGSTIWNMNSKGNYWSDYDSSDEGCIDADANGICDAPYNKSTGVLDNFASVKAV